MPVYGNYELREEDILKVERFSVFAGTREGKNHQLLFIKWHDTDWCCLDVVAVKKPDGWLFFCDSERNYSLLKKSLGEKDTWKEMFDEISEAVRRKNSKAVFLAHVGLLSAYRAHWSKKVDISDFPGIEEPEYETRYFDDTVQIPEELQDRGNSKCLILKDRDFTKLYKELDEAMERGLKKRRAEAKERKRKEEEACLARKKREAELRSAMEERRKEEEKRQKELKIREAGKKGEQEVDYVIKWLEALGYRAVPKKIGGKYHDETILLRNDAFIDETQEYDHIVVGPQGVFMIETKNYLGKLVINQSGNWIRIKDGVKAGTRSPVQQVRRHEKVLRSFLPEKIPIISIICIAHPEVIIEGAENCTVPLVKSDLLGDFIENYPAGDKALTGEEIQMCLDAIEKYRQN